MTETESLMKEFPLIDFLTKENIPFKVTEQNIVVAETTKCTEEQKDKMLEIEKCQHR